ncbi:MAG: hypothetical protein RIF33_01980 [Cyclobacteriaceae bacterium]
MRTLVCCFLSWILTYPVFAQDQEKLSINDVKPVDYECGTIASPEELEAINKRDYVGNNKVLLTVLREHGFSMPDDYFDQLDNMGLYNGKELLLSEVKGDLGLRPGEELLDEQTVVSAIAATGGTVYYFPVKFWIHRNSALQDGVSLSELTDRLVKAQKIFWDNGLPIQFYVKCNIQYINNSPYFDIADDNEADAMFGGTYRDNNALNIHGVRTAHKTGQADGIPSKACFIRQGTSNTLLAHELGHNFGLQHTHVNMGISSADNGGAGNCEQEPVSRTMLQGFSCSPVNYNKKKCEVNGDKLCDTPGDPNIEGITVNGSCQLTGAVGTDNWGVTWTPMVTNVMSYANSWTCADVFTYGQKAIILSEINKSLFSFKSTSASGSISGPSKICPNQYYTFSTSISSGSPFDYEWLIPSGWNIIGQGSSSVSIRASGATYGEYVQVMPLCGGSVSRKYVEVDDKTIAITGPSQVPNESYPRNYSYYTEYYSGASYTWSAPPGWSVTSGQGTFSASLRAPAFPSPGYVSVTVNNICGTVVSKSKYVSIGGSGTPPLLVAHGNERLFAPNPVDAELKLVQADEGFMVTNVIMVSLSSGEQVFNVDVIKSGESLNVAGLKEGYYIIRYLLNGELVEQTIIKR